MKNDKRFKKIGILGGMGPIATLDLYRWIIELTPAQKDQDHLPLLITNIPQIPDRTKYILGEGNDPKPNLLSSLKQLEKMGAEIVAMPCNTAHYFIDYLRVKSKNIELVDMIEETKKYLEARFCDPNSRPNLGLLATTGTIETRIYQKYFKEWKILTPQKDIQDKNVMKSIYGNNGIKRGHTKKARELLRKAVNHLHENGAEIILLGCTEISFVLRNEKNNGVAYINPVKIVAGVLIKKASDYEC